MAKQVFISPIDEAFLTERDTLGDIRWEGNRCYKYVKLRNEVNAVSADIGHKVIYKTDNGHNDNTVTMSENSEPGDIVAGVISAPADGVLLVEYYMWIQIKGPVLLSNTVISASDVGDTVTTGINDFIFTASSILDGDNYKQICGIVTNTAFTTILLDCPF